MPRKIEVKDLANVVVDGVSYGSLVDVLSNHPPAKHRELCQDVNAGLVEWQAGQKEAGKADLASAAAANAATCEGLRARHREEVAGLRAEFEAERARWQTAAAEAEGRHAAELADREEAVREQSRAEAAKRAAHHGSECEGLRKRVADLESQVAAFGGTELGKRLAKEAAIRAAREARAKADAELARLEAEEDPS
jgi:hypothetical protein